MWWLVSTAGPAIAVGASAISFCSKSREVAHKSSKKGSKHGSKGGSSATRRRSASKSGRRGDKSARSAKSGRSGKSGKSGKSARSRSRKRGSKSGKSARSASRSKSRASANKSGRSTKSKTAAKKVGSATATATAKGVSSDKSSRSAKSTKTARSSKSTKSSKGKPTDKTQKSTKSQKMSAAISAVQADKNADKIAKSEATKATGKEVFEGNGAVNTVDLQMKPAELHWKPTGGLQTIHVANNTSEKRAIKVKCSDNIMYRVSPVFQFVEPGQSVKIDVLRQNGTAKTDKMLLLTTQANAENPKQCFEEAGAPKESMVLPLLVATE